MAEVGMVILWDATTRSTRNNDGQSKLHTEVSFAWDQFTGGYVNSTYSDPPWYVGKPGPFDAEGRPVLRTFHTVAFFEKGSATHLYLKVVGLDEFLQRFLKASPDMQKALREAEVTNVRLERWQR